ncbi:MAG: branched-chain amino acid ABC transporter permease, partial [Pseudomonadota bacterium]
MDQIMFNLGMLTEFPVLNLKIIIDGMLIGAIFALAAYGLALVWGVMNVKNLAQGDFVIAGGYVAWWLAGMGLPPLLGVPAAALVMALFGGAMFGTAPHRWIRAQGERAMYAAIAIAIVFMVGIYLKDSAEDATLQATGQWVSGITATVLAGLFIAAGGTYGLIISRVIERDLFTSLLATFGVAIVMAQLLNLLFGSDTQSINLGYDTLFFADGLIDVPIAKLIGVGMAAALAIAVILFMKRSRMGQAIRATAQDARAARVMGIDTEKVYAFTFSLNAAICGAAGALIVMVWLIQPFYGI